MSLHFPIYPPNEEEILRRAACSRASEVEKQLMRECLRDAEYLIDYHITERNRPVSLLEEMEREAPEDFAAGVHAEELAACSALVIFTASLGETIRREIEDCDEPEKKIFYQAICAERLDALCESYCDNKEKRLHEEGAYITPHYPFFWPGVSENACVTTRIMGVSLDPQSHAPERCRTCFVRNCPSRSKEELKEPSDNEQ